MMRRLVGLFCIAGMGVFMMVLLGACQHKDLFFDDHYQLVDVNIHWEDGVLPPPKGMRVEFYTLHDMSTEIGTEDFASSYGGKLRMLPSSEYHILCYDYLGSENNKIKHNREFDQAQVYTNSYNRASYSRAFPDELLVTQPDPFYMSKIDDYIVDNPWRVDLYTSNRVETYTFEIRKVKGARFITSIGGACSGLSASYFLGREEIAGDLCTVVFDAEKDNVNDRIVGRFRTFGHCNDASVNNHLTIEIRYPSGDPNNGYKMKTWDVTDQMHNGTHHIILDWNIEVIPTGEAGAGFDVVVQPWDEVWIPMEL